MIFIYHTKAKKQLEIRKNGKILTDFPSSLVACFWQLCKKFPDELILWIDSEQDIVPANQLKKTFKHPLIMASYPVKDYYIPDAIGYIDQLPFVNPKRFVQYPTWRMSTDIGGVFGKTALQFKPILEEINDFGYLINSMAKIGQQNSLFCYSSPEIVQNPVWDIKKSHLKVSSLFRFTAQHYKKVWLLILLLGFIKYERKFPVWSFFKSLFRKSFFQQNVDLSEIEIVSERDNNTEETIDVIIPTLGRPGHLKNVLIDLKNQHILPNQVIVVEQNPIENSESELEYLNSEEWPFKIIHHFTHQLGACNARNVALSYVKSDWVFFADDDIRFDQNLLEKAMHEIKRLSIFSLNLNSLQRGEKTAFNSIKQWGAFGTCSSIVKSKYALGCHFWRALEYGYGEDIDYGMQLRNSGCDIIYHPDIIIMHLKAERGGFRQTMKKNDSKTNEIKPKPSPTMMLIVQKHYNLKMQKGYKMNLFIKFFGRQSIKNPFLYYSTMQKRWRLSEKLSLELQESARN